MLASMLTTNKSLLKELDALQIEVILPGDRSQLAVLQLTSSLVERIKEHQKEDPELAKTSKKVEEGKGQEFSLKNGVLLF